MAIWRCDSTQNNKNMTSTLPIQKGITILCRVIPCTSSTVHLQERMKEIRVQLIIEGVLLFGLNLILFTALSTCTNPYFPWPSKGVYRYSFWTCFTIIKFDKYFWNIIIVIFYNFFHSEWLSIDKIVL